MNMSILSFKKSRRNKGLYIYYIITKWGRGGETLTLIMFDDIGGVGYFYF